MIRNYFKVSIRYLLRNKGYTAINLLGLSVGLACCLLIMLFVKSEWSFDRQHKNADRIYRAWLQEHYEGQVFTNTVTPLPLVPVLQAGIPAIESACRVSAFSTLVTYQNNSFNEPVNMVDSNFFNLFDFPVADGNITNPFPSKNSLIITERSAKKYFGEEAAIGKSLALRLGVDTVVFNVTAVLKDLPLESSIQFDMLVPFSNGRHIYSQGALTQAWSNVTTESYFMLKPSVQPSAVNAMIATILQPLVAKNYKPGEYNVTLQPLTEIHLNNKLPAGNQPVSDPKYAYILATVGILILLIACINFVILSVGRSSTRAMEVGVRKVLGAERRQLIRQFWGEALLLTLVALVAAVAIAIILQKPFGQLANRPLHFSLNAFTVGFCFLLAAVIALLAGIYPAFILSGFKPIQVLKGKLKLGNNRGFFRNSLVVAQFVASIVLIIGTITVGRQLNYLQSKDLGYNKEHVIVVPTNKGRREGTALASRFKHEIESNPSVISSTVSLFSMAQTGWMNLGYIDNKETFRQFQFNAIDADFVPAMQLQIVSGRTFSKDNTADSNYILVNQALVKEYGWKDPLGQRLPGKYKQEVIGVVKDFNVQSLHSPVTPLVMALKPDSIFSASSDVNYNFPPQPRVTVRFSEGSVKEHIEFLKSRWKSVAGDQDFEYQFLDDALKLAYQQEQRLGKIVTYASVLSIFIACLGLFGLATLVVARRTKEIGIRKVLGAEVPTLVGLLSKDFIVLVFIAAILAFPVAWWALNKWLQDFAYRISISWWVFVIAAITVLVIALLTVSIQAIKAAIANPVKSLRTE